MEIKKTIDNVNHKQYAFIKDNKIFKISFGSNGDLYWSLTNLNIEEDLDYDVFTISIEDNYEVYSLLKKLYLDIKNAKISDIDDEFPLFRFNRNEDLDDYEKNLNTKYKEKEKAQKLKEREAYNLLFNDDKIIWVSDDRDYDKDQMVIISQKDNTFILEFVRKDKEDKDIYHYMTSFSSYLISIRFRNSGSTYDPFNVIFMNMYNSLAHINFEKDDVKQIEGQISIFEHQTLFKK